MPIDILVSNQPLGCDQQTFVDRFDMYLSNINVQVQGEWRPASTGSDLVLLTLKPCSGNTNSDTLFLEWSGGGIPNALSFEVGVPHELNHGLPTQAGYPLDQAYMFWTWQQGYKFLNLEGRARGKPFLLHLGSTGCASPAPIRPPSAPCSRPNRLQIRLEPFNVAKDGIAIDIGKLMTSLAGTRCTGNYGSDDACVAVLQLLGLDVGTGTCGDGCGREVFVGASNR